MKGSVYIYGPQGVGKSHHSQAFARLFGLTYILDGYENQAFPISGTLVLGQRKLDSAPQGVKQYTFKAAFKKLKLKERRDELRSTNGTDRRSPTHH